MPKYDDFDLDIQNTKQKELFKEDELVMLLLTNNMQSCKSCQKVC